MDLKDRTVLVLGGAGLVGIAVARRVLESDPRRLVVASLREHEVQEALEELRTEYPDHSDRMEGYWGDLFVLDDMRHRPRGEINADPQAREALVDDLYGELTLEVLQRSALGKLLLDLRPDIVVD